MIRLTRDEVINMHTMLIEQTGGTDGLRENSLLESSIYGIYQTFDGEELYPTDIEKSARLAYNLISNHPFVDGNKRIGLLAMLVVLEKSGI